MAIAHAESLFPLMSDPRITTYLAWEPHATVAETAAMLAALARASERDAGYHWAIFDRSVAIGLISLIDVRRQHRSWRLERAEIAYWVAPEQQGRGVATQATAAVVQEAFGTLRLHRLIVSHAGPNPASGRIPQKLGFRYVGFEREFFFKNGRWHDMHHYELLAEEWPLAKVLRSDADA